MGRDHRCPAARPPPRAGWAAREAVAGQVAAAPSVQDSQSAIAVARRGSLEAYPCGACQGD